MTFLIGCLLGLIIGFVGTTLRTRTQPQPITIMTPQPTATAEPTATVAPTATPGPVRVYVNGAVLVEDVFSLPAGSLIGDAIDAAGGFSEEADGRALNLALPLADGMHIYVPTAEEAAGEDLPAAPVVSLPATASAPVATVPAEVGAGGAPGTTTTAGGLMNINAASAAELEELPGIGPALAQRIVDHRNSNGPFATIEAIQDVSGIGPAKYEAIKDLITVE